MGVMDVRTVFAAFLPIFLLFTGSIVHANEIYAGSTVSFYFENCINMTVDILCSNTIEDGEFTLYPNCSLLNSTIHTQRWSCSCTNKYTLEITTSPASRNNCTFIITYVERLLMPEKVVEYHHSSSDTIVKEPELINTTTIERVVYVPSENYTSNIEYLNETVQNLSKKIDELYNLTQELKQTTEPAEGGNDPKALAIVVLMIFILLVFLVKLPPQGR